MTTIIIVVTLFIIFCGLRFGARQLSFPALFQVLRWPDGSIDSFFVWSLRLPRSLAAFLAGAGLAISGYLLQTLTRNPLAGPGLTGAMSGAVTVIVFFFVFVPAVSSIYYPFIGLAGAMAAALTTFWIGHGGVGRPLHLALGGISISLLLNAMTTYILLLSGPQSTAILFWLSGGLQGRSWMQVAWMTPWVIVAFLGAMAAHRILSLLTLNEASAATMGMNFRIWKPLLLLLSILPVAGVVPVAGPIAFVGLAAPHIIRLWGVKGSGWMVVLTASLGGMIVVIADIIARSVATPRELPVSIITALIGGPIFIYLVQNRRFSLNAGKR